ncbi:NAD(P)/FAD-dependent oxidoreductase [Streptomyces lydicamycinicus]|uniref:NAD(P)/FAD-dependent oxidoreductase n=1 Tax=Streptomyces lydicamycinicus TaxID=1546107 RepID=UPI0032DFB546
MSPAPAPAYDVVVAGGGPAGCAAALTLVHAGRTVLLADAGSGPPKAGEALVSMGRLLLADLGVAEPVLGSGHLPCHGNLSAWGSPELHAVDFLHDPYGHGWHLDRPLFDRRLRAAAGAAGAEVAEHTAVRSPSRQSDGTWRLALRDRAGGGGDRTVCCRWVVDATGRGAAIAVRSGARRRTGDQLTALHLTLDPAPQTPSTAVRWSSRTRTAGGTPRCCLPGTVWSPTSPTLICPSPPHAEPSGSAGGCWPPGTSPAGPARTGSPPCARPAGPPPTAHIWTGCTATAGRPPGTRRPPSTRSVPRASSRPSTRG